MKTDIKKIALLGAMTAISMIFSYVETMFPIILPVPGVKIGFANALIVLALYMFGPIEALIVGILRIVLTALLFGSVISFLMSLSGFALSFLIMYLLFRSNKFSIPGVSLAGGAFHNFGQLITACILMGSTALIKDTVWFAVFGIITGMAVGFLSKIVYERVKLNDRIFKG
ncbi:MAG: Gx transporter family protein [Lachnospiraceae bacterium]|nr:Gx transporter family protein [Lachnospiraceae bacterium]